MNPKDPKRDPVEPEPDEQDDAFEEKTLVDHKRPEMPDEPPKP